MNEPGTATSRGQEALRDSETNHDQPSPGRSGSGSLQDVVKPGSVRYPLHVFPLSKCRLVGIWNPDQSRDTYEMRTRMGAVGVV